MLIYVPNATTRVSPPPNAASSSVSKYNILQSVKYNVKMNYTSEGSQSGTYPYKIPRINDRTPNSTLTRYCPPYQESTLLYNNKFTIEGGSSEKKVGVHDRFNNTYDAANISKGFLGSFKMKLSQEYNVTLNQVSYSNISDSDIGNYDYADIMFDLYCNNSDYYNMNTSDPELRNLVLGGGNQVGIVPTDNPVEKARKIINWISSNINYTEQDKEKGASWAFDERKGDCSEYADLMITLLRILNIPARKVTGLLVSNDPSFRPFVGDQLDYTFSNLPGKETNVMGHAWIEYYVPSIGWIACDPTWHGYYNYLDRKSVV